MTTETPSAPTVDTEPASGQRLPLIKTKDTASPPHDLQAVAIDFGTSSSTVTLAHSAEGAQADVDDRWGAERSEIVMRRIAEWFGPTTQWPGSADQHRALLRTVVDSLGRAAQGATTWPELTERLLKDAEFEKRIADDPRWTHDEHEKKDPRLRRDLISTTLERSATAGGADGSAPAAWRDWIAINLDRIYRTAFEAVALDQKFLVPVLLAEGGHEIPSWLSVSDDSARLGVPTDDRSFPGLKRHLGDVRKVAGLPAGAEGSPWGSWRDDTDFLIALAYADLVDRLHDFGGRRDTLRGRRINQATVTYPTVTPPATRERLRRLVADAVGLAPVNVNVDYDEGVAAALYVILRELGGDQEHGVDALRVRSRSVPGHPTRWQRTMLVLDVGGGTTDIALVSLELEDRTPPVPAGATNMQRLFAPREFHLRPRVLGTGGHAQLGGDLLTLRVFYWIKAQLADALIENEVEGVDLADRWKAVSDESPPSRLAPEVVAFSGRRPAPRPVIHVLQELLPTHLVGDESSSAETGGPEGTCVDSSGGAQGTVGTRAFRALWRVAENAKIRLAGGEAHVVTSQNILTAQEATTRASTSGTAGDAGPPSGGSMPGLWSFVKPTDLKLTVDDFAILARPVLEEAMTLGATMTRQRLGRGADEPVLDTLALTGRTCGMPQAAEVAREIFGAVLGAREKDRTTGSRVLWNPGTLVVERRHAKQAASIGACWIQARKNVGEDNEGHTTLRIDVDNLLLQMPCGFDVETTDHSAPIFEPGVPLDHVAADGARYAVSAWHPMRSEINLQRRVDGGDFIRWGRFRYRNKVDEELAAFDRTRHGQSEEAAPEVPERPEDEPPASWRTATSATDLPDDLRYCLIVDQRLRPTLCLARGPHEELLVDPLDGGPAAHLDLRSASREHPVALPPIRVRMTDAPPDSADALPLFPHGNVELAMLRPIDEGSDDAGWYDGSWTGFTDRPPRAGHRPRAAPRTDRSPFPGVVSLRPLPLPETSSTVVWDVEVGEGEDARSHRIELDGASRASLEPDGPVSGDAGHAARGPWLALAANGDLYILRRPPGWATVTSLAAMENDVGKVVTFGLTDISDSRDRYRDPFSGVH